VGRGKGEAKRKRVNSSEEKTANPYRVFENGTNLFHANAAEKAKSTSFL